jgi:adenine phosphoribosyltransferase
MFKDITPLLGNPLLFAEATDRLVSPFMAQAVTHVVAIESRGFILGGPAARALNAGFVPVRKPGKLPFTTEGIEYALEYGSDRLEVHVDACASGARVVVIDDVLATGGTAAATCALLERVGAEVVGCAFLLEITALAGRDRLGPRKIHTVLRF